MLCVNQYPKDYVDTRRLNIEAQLKTYQKLKAGAPPAAIAAFDPHFCHNLVLVLDASFMHRACGREEKDGNPLNEVRMLAAPFLHSMVPAPSPNLAPRARSPALPHGRIHQHL